MKPARHYVRCSQGHVFDGGKRQHCPTCNELVVRDDEASSGAGGPSTLDRPAPSNRRLLIPAVVAGLALVASGAAFLLWPPPERPGPVAPSTPVPKVATDLAAARPGGGSGSNPESAETTLALTPDPGTPAAAPTEAASAGPDPSQPAPETTEAPQHAVFPAPGGDSQDDRAGLPQPSHSIADKQAGPPGTQPQPQAADEPPADPAALDIKVAGAQPAEPPMSEGTLTPMRADMAPVQQPLPQAMPLIGAPGPTSAKPALPEPIPALADPASIRLPVPGPTLVPRVTEVVPAHPPAAPRPAAPNRPADGDGAKPLLPAPRIADVRLPDPLPAAPAFSWPPAITPPPQPRSTAGGQELPPPSRQASIDDGRIAMLPQASKPAFRADPPVVEPSASTVPSAAPTARSTLPRPPQGWDPYQQLASLPGAGLGVGVRTRGWSGAGRR